MHDADNLERVQQALNAMADALDAGALPKILSDVKTKEGVNTLVRKGLTGGGGYYDVIPSSEYADKSAKGIALQSLMDKSLMGEQVEKQKERAKEKELIYRHILTRKITAIMPAGMSIFIHLLYCLR